MTPRMIPPHRWQDAERAHQHRVDHLVAGHLERALRGERHPGEDFLFTYYSLRPAQLRRWHPGAGQALLEPPGGRRPPAQAAWRWYTTITVDGGDHTGWPLRLGSAATDAVLEEHQVHCTHYDAFRFFTEHARPHNAVQPTRADQVALEQPGCLHATMDLYKVAYKLLPATPSELVVDCFELARQARILDMRVSPYDVRPLGYRPLAVETPQGRAEFADEQRQLTERGAVLRARLLQVCTELVDGAPDRLDARPGPVARCPEPVTVTDSRDAEVAR